MEPSPILHAPTPAGRGPLLAFLTPEDRHDFFPAQQFDELAGLLPGFRVENPVELGAAGVARVLDELRPEVLLTGWKMAKLPARLPPELRYLCHLCGTVKSFATRRHFEDGLLATNWGGSIARTVAEAALFLTLASLRRAAHWSLAMHLEGAWKTRDAETASLFGRRVGMHGFGHVAREFIRLLAPFGCPVRVCAPDVDAAAEEAFGIRSSATLEALFEDSQVVIELAPLNASTVGCITEPLLRRLGPGGVFVNAGRGGVVDEAGLIRVAREGEIFFGLDVFAVEPLPPAHPLRGLRNVMLTPHLAGPTTDRRCDAGAHALRNLRAYLAGGPLEAVITPEAFDRSS